MIVTLSPHGWRAFQDEISEIAAAVHDAAPDLDIVVEDPTKATVAPGRYGSIWGEILNVSVPFMAGYAFDKVADAIVERARLGWEERQAHKANPRPRIIQIYGPNGELLRRVRMPEDDSETPYPIFVVREDGSSDTSDLPESDQDSE